MANKKDYKLGSIKWPLSHYLNAKTFTWVRSPAFGSLDLVARLSRAILWKRSPPVRKENTVKRTRFGKTCSGFVFFI